MKDKIRLSGLTIGFGIYIVISASFMLQIRNWLFDVLGDSVVIISFRAFFILLSLAGLLYSLRINLRLLRVCAVIAIFIVSFIFSLRQPYFSEKTHILTYGLLGFLALKDLLGPKSRARLKSIVLALGLAALVSASDELFQSILPYRVCEFRDFLTNLISAGFGISLMLALNKG